MTIEQRIAALVRLGCTPEQIKLELAGIDGLPQAELGRPICRIAAQRGNRPHAPPVAHDEPPRTPVAIRHGRADGAGHTVPLPQEFVNRWLAHPERAELRCYIYICRRTWSSSCTAS